MRKHVKPAHPQAAIPDPTRGGDLPPKGLVVEWSVHWARLAQRGDIIVSDVDETATGPSAGKQPAKNAKLTSAAPSNTRPATQRRPLKSKTDVPAETPTGDAPAESGPQVDGPEMDSPSAPAAPEPSIT